MGVVDCPVQSVLVALVHTVQVDCDLHWSIQNLHILQEFSHCSLYLEEKNTLLMRNIQVNFLRDILAETSKSSAFWEMGWNSNLKWLPLFSTDEAGMSDGTNLWGLRRGR